MIKELFQNENILLKKEQLSYKEFYNLCLENAHTISNNTQNVSIQFSQDLTNLIDLVSLWILGKSVVLYSNSEPYENVVKRNSTLQALPIEKNGNQFNNTLDLNTDNNNTAVYIFTSGSSSTPKAIPLTYENLFTSANNFIDFYKVEVSNYLPITLPMYHIGGLQIFIRTIISNASTDILKPNSLEKSSFTSSPSFLSVVPLQLDKIISSKDLHFFKNTNFIIGGAKLLDRTINEIKKNNLKASVTYGMTETAAMCLATSLTSNPELLKTVGGPLGKTKVTILSNSKLAVKSSCVSPLFDNNYIETNDLAKRDEAGNFIIIGRADGVFISGGENINPQEIEEMLFNEGLPKCYLTNVADKKLQSAGFLFFDSALDKEDVIQSCNDNLHPFKVPKYFYPIVDSSNGIKVQKSLLAKRANIITRILDSKTKIPFNCHGDPDKEWVLLIHGFTGDQLDWTEVIKHLEKDLFFITIDCPGHGNYLIEEKIELNTFLKDLKNLINSLDKKPHLLGYSQGARLAVGTALQDADIKSLILESGSVGIVDETERDRRYKSDLNLLLSIKNKNDLRDFFENWYSNSLFGSLKELPSFNKFITKKIQHDHNQWQLALHTLSVGTQENYRPKLKKLTIPKLTICGSKDHKYFAQSKELETQYGFVFNSIKEVSHNTHLEDSLTFSSVIRSFVISNT
jgi:2-succinyl-6-hydroxy-2,4-cyclohexadiene-1-carboxylate synthase